VASRKAVYQDKNCLLFSVGSSPSCSLWLSVLADLLPRDVWRAVSCCHNELRPSGRITIMVVIIIIIIIIVMMIIIMITITRFQSGGMWLCISTTIILGEGI
jgi:hypothetical protein